MGKADEVSGAKLDDGLLASLPGTLRDELERLQMETDPRVKLQAMCLSLIPMTFQYLALVLSGEYLNSEYPPEMDATDSLWAMILRPGPGKWAGFIREAAKYFEARPPRVLSPEAIRAIAMTITDPKRPRVRIGQGDRSSGKLDYWEALTNLLITHPTR
jgi:hypothetical protein